MINTLKKRPIIYIAGKVTGLPMEEVITRFHTKEKELTSRGYFVLNPVQLVREELPETAEWELIMRLCIQYMMQADEIYMLHDWQKSKGAKIEHDLAKELSLNIIYESAPVYTGIVKTP